MRKKVGIIKRLFALLLVFLLNINSFAAIVSDNDGSAFITKAEFDALKSSFQSQIDSYNQSIDSKIDGAIASYLAGIKLSTTEERAFPVGAGGTCFLFDSSLDDLDPGTYGLSWDWTTLLLGTNDSNGSTTGNLSMKRDAQYDAEVFMYDTSTNEFLFWDKLKINLISSLNAFDIATWTSYENKTWTQIRWGGGATTPRTKKKYDTTTTSNWYSYYYPQFSDPAFPCVFSTGHTFYWSIPYGERIGKSPMKGYFSWTPTVAFENSASKCTLAMDRASSTNQQIWVAGPAITPEMVWQEEKGDRYDETKYDNFLTPDEAGVTTHFFITQHGGTGLGNTFLEGSGWITDVAYNVTTPGTKADPPTTSRYFYDFELLLSTADTRNIKLQSLYIPSDVSSAYLPYGWVGSLIQGLPITELNAGDSVEFDVDTSSQGGDDVIIGVKTYPFVRADDMDSLSLSSDIDFFVDNAAVTTGSKLLTKASHKIKIKNKSADKKPVFYKLAYKSVLGKNKRGTIVLPSTMTITKAN